LSQQDRLREVLTKALDAAQNGLAWDSEVGVYFSYFILPGEYWVQIAFDGFFSIHKQDRMAANGRVPADLLKRVCGILPGLPEPLPEDDWLPF